MDVTPKHKKIMLVLCSIIGIALLTFVTVKACVTSFTHDESFTYLRYVHQSFMDIISYKTPYTNNHILNTVLIKYSEHFFGRSELALRLPNVLACALYLIYTYKLVRRTSVALILSCFICLMCNTHFIDFFSLARGYGLSFAFMMMSFYHLTHSFNSAERKHTVLFNIGAFFAVLSNFSLLNYYISALITYNLLLFIDSKSKREGYNFFRLNRINLIACVIFTAVLYEPIRRISKQGMLDFGGKTGFLEDTFGSLVRGVFYETPLTQPVYYVILFLIISMLILTGLLIIKKLFAKTYRFFYRNRLLVVVYFILLFIMTLSYAQHFIIHNDFYNGRFALFLYPLVMLNFVFYITYFYRTKYRVCAVLVSTAVSCLLLINFCVNMNLRFYQDWKYDSETKAVMTILTADHANTNSKDNVKLGINWLFEPTTNFYRYTQNLTWLKKTGREGIRPGDTYYYIFSADTNAYLASGKKVLFLPEGLNTMLVRNKE